MRKLTWSQFAARIHHALTDEGVAIGPLQTALVAEVVLNELWAAVQNRDSIKTPVGTFTPFQRASRRYRVPGTDRFVTRTGPLKIKHTPKE